MSNQGLLLKHIGNILNALVRLDHINEQVFRRLSLLAQSIPLQHDAQSISLIANAFAKAEIKDIKLFAFLSNSALALPTGDIGAQSLAVLANAYAKSGVRDHALFRRLCLHALTLQDEEFDEQSIANIVNAFAKNSLSWPRHAGVYVCVCLCMYLCDYVCLYVCMCVYFVWKVCEYCEYVCVNSLSWLRHDGMYVCIYVRMYVWCRVSKHILNGFVKNSLSWPRHAGVYVCVCGLIFKYCEHIHAYIHIHTYIYTDAAPSACNQ